MITSAFDERGHSQETGLRIGVPDISIDGGLLTWSVSVDGLATAPERLWFTVPEEHAGLVTHLADPAVIGLMVPAMRAGSPMIVDGPVTDELAHNLTHGYQQILEAVIPDLRRIDLEIEDAVPASDPARGVGTGFSGGIDSFAVLAEHHFQPVSADQRLTHLTLFNVGAMTSGEAGRRRFRRLHSLLSPSAERIGLPFIPVDSNLDDFYAAMGFRQTHGPRNLSAASLLQGGLGRYYFASGYAFGAVSIRRAPSTAYSDPISMPLLATRQFRPVVHGSQYTRVEKTLIVADVPETHEALHVCTTLTVDGRNCSRCSKCLRTELTLEIAGMIDAYHRAFDLDVYHRVRRAYLDEAASSRGEYTAEIRHFAQERGFPLPSPAAGSVRHALRRAARKSDTIRRRFRRTDPPVASVGVSATG